MKTKDADRKIDRHPTERAERSVTKVLNALADDLRYNTAGASLEDVATRAGKPAEWVERCLKAGRASGHTAQTREGLWTLTADGWDRVHGTDRT